MPAAGELRLLRLTITACQMLYPCCTKEKGCSEEQPQTLGAGEFTGLEPVYRRFRAGGKLFIYYLIDANLQLGQTSNSYQAV